MMVKSMIGVGVDMLSELILGVNFDMLSDMEIILMMNPGITLGSVVSVAYVVDVLTVLIIDSVTAIDVSTLAGENVNGLAAVMTPLEFNLSSP